MFAVKGAPVTEANKVLIADDVRGWALRVPLGLQAAWGDVRTKQTPERCETAANSELTMGSFED